MYNDNQFERFRDDARKRLKHFPRDEENSTDITIPVYKLKVLNTYDRRTGDKKQRTVFSHGITQETSETPHYWIFKEEGEEQSSSIYIDPMKEKTEERESVYLNSSQELRDIYSGSGDIFRVQHVSAAWVNVSNVAIPETALILILPWNQKIENDHNDNSEMDFAPREEFSFFKQLEMHNINNEAHSECYARALMDAFIPRSDEERKKEWTHALRNNFVDLYDVFFLENYQFSPTCKYVKDNPEQYGENNKHNAVCYVITDPFYLNAVCSFWRPVKATEHLLTYPRKVMRFDVWLDTVAKREVRTAHKHAMALLIEALSLLGLLRDPPFELGFLALCAEDFILVPNENYASSLERENANDFVEQSINARMYCTPDDPSRYDSDDFRTSNIAYHEGFIQTASPPFNFNNKNDISEDVGLGKRNWCVREPPYRLMLFNMNKVFNLGGRRLEEKAQRERLEREYQACFTGDVGSHPTSFSLRIHNKGVRSCTVNCREQSYWLPLFDVKIQESFPGKYYRDKWLRDYGYSISDKKKRKNETSEMDEREKRGKREALFIEAGEKQRKGKRKGKGKEGEGEEEGEEDDDDEGEGEFYSDPSENAEREKVSPLILTLKELKTLFTGVQYMALERYFSTVFEKELSRKGLLDLGKAASVNQRGILSRLFSFWICRSSSSKDPMMVKLKSSHTGRGSISNSNSSSSSSNSSGSNNSNNDPASYENTTVDGANTVADSDYCTWRTTSLTRDYRKAGAKGELPALFDAKSDLREKRDILTNAHYVQFTEIRGGAKVAKGKTTAHNRKLVANTRDVASMERSKTKTHNHAAGDLAWVVAKAWYKKDADRDTDLKNFYTYYFDDREGKGKRIPFLEQSWYNLLLDVLYLCGDTFKIKTKAEKNVIKDQTNPENQSSKRFKLYLPDALLDVLSRISFTNPHCVPTLSQGRIFEYLLACNSVMDIEHFTGRPNFVWLTDYNVPNSEPVISMKNASHYHSGYWGFSKAIPDLGVKNKAGSVRFTSVILQGRDRSSSKENDLFKIPRIAKWMTRLYGTSTKRSQESNSRSEKPPPPPFSPSPSSPPRHLEEEKENDGYSATSGAAYFPFEEQVQLQPYEDFIRFNNPVYDINAWNAFYGVEESDPTPFNTEYDGSMELFNVDPIKSKRKIESENNKNSGNNITEKEAIEGLLRLVQGVNINSK